VADITVQVSSAGLTDYGYQQYGYGSFGGDQSPRFSINTPEAYNEIGWGGKQWNFNLWGDLLNNTIIPTGNSLTLSVGNETAEGIVNEGWGRKTYGSNIWNGYGTVIPSNLSLATSVESVTIDNEINTGWGALTWGTKAWGIRGDVLLSGNQASFSIDSNQDPWGQETWSSYNTRWGGTGSVDIGIFNEAPITQAEELNSTTGSVSITIATEVFLSENPLNALTISEGTVDPAPDVMPSGVTLATSLGTVQAYNEQGWGRDDWGTEAWGAEGEWAFVDVTGQSLSIGSSVTQTWGEDTWGSSNTEWGGVSITDVDVSVNVPVSSQFNPGWGSTIEWGQQLWGQATVDISMTADEGTVDPAPDTDITGVQLNTTVNAISITADANIIASGQQLTLTLGDETSEAVTIASPAGIQLTTTMGVPTAGLSVEASPTGVTMTTSTGIIGSNAWELVDPGTSPTWTVVDKAA
jgi:hypothetical protein